MIGLAQTLREKVQDHHVLEFFMNAKVCANGNDEKCEGRDVVQSDFSSMDNPSAGRHCEICPRSLMSHEGLGLGAGRGLIGPLRPSWTRFRAPGWTQTTLVFALNP